MQIQALLLSIAGCGSETKGVGGGGMETNEDSSEPGSQETSLQPGKSYPGSFFLWDPDVQLTKAGNDSKSSVGGGGYLTPGKAREVLGQQTLLFSSLTPLTLPYMPPLTGPSFSQFQPSQPPVTSYLSVDHRVKN